MLQIGTYLQDLAAKRVCDDAASESSKFQLPVRLLRIQKRKDINRNGRQGEEQMSNQKNTFLGYQVKDFVAEGVVETFPKCEVSKARRKVINALIKVAVGE